MHIPENYLSPATCGVMTVGMIPAWVHSVKKVSKELPKEKVAMLGVGAAFSFLGMLFNVPLPGGTTGHAVGGTLIALLFGPEAACIAVTIALLIQAVLFGDGGILAFGANCFNMAFILPFVGYYLYTFIKGKIKGTKGELIGAIVGSYIGLNAAAFLTSIEFGIQPYLFKDPSGYPLYCPYGLNISIPAMMIPHLLVAGVVEALFTVFVYSFIKKTSPQVISDGVEKTGKKPFPVFALVAALVVLTPLGLLASGTAWGEWGADEIAEIVQNGSELGFTPSGMETGFGFEAIMPDYTIGDINEVVAYIASAICGVALLVIFFKIVSSFKKEK